MDELQTTRRCLHGVAELVMAGPMFARSGTIHLRATPGGFGTVADPDLRVDGTDLVAGHHRLPLNGTTPRQLAEQLELEVGGPGVYSDGSDVTPDEVLRVSPSAARELADAFAAGKTALAEFAPDEQSVLWPEHFDIGITIGRVNYGVSPGDDHVDVPYAYVGPWDPVEGAFWNAPFGATRTLRDLAGDQTSAETPVASVASAIVEFFREGSNLL